MTEQILIKELIKDKKVGAIASTSKYVIKELLNKIDFDKAEVVIEYGPGNGVITRKLLRKMKDSAFLFVFETNESFIKELTLIPDRRLIIINSDASQAKVILKNRYKIEQADYIISTIPFSFMKRRQRKRIISRSYSILKQKGKFITCQYSWLIFGLIKQTFASVSIRPAFFNIPPAFILEGIK